MVLYRVQVEVEGALRLQEEFTLDGFQFVPTSNGFSLIFQLDASSTEGARRNADAQVQLLMDSLTFEKGPSLHYRICGINEVPRTESGSQVVTGQAFMTTNAYLVITEPRAGLVPAFELINKILSHSKRELLTRVLRWYARGTGDIDKMDKFTDYWVALEALANSYNGEVEAFVCPNPKCRLTLNPRPVNGILRAYLKSLGMTEEAERMSTLTKARSKLFHEASTARALENLAEVQAILKDCIHKELP